MLFRSRRHDGFFTALSTVSSLWLGADHLLMIDSNRFTERYKRFYFRDIQAFIVVKTSRRLKWNVALGIFAFASLTIALATTPALIPLLTLFFLTLIVFNQVLGPSATVYIRTAVQVEELPSLNRIRRARRALEKLRPLIAAAQGELSSEEGFARMRELQAAARGTTLATSPLNLSS